MNSIIIEESAVRKTLSILQDAGMKKVERVLLWLAPVKGDTLRVKDIYIPLQTTKIDYFNIPRNGVVLMLQHLREHKLKVVAQVHSHPQEAFHSPADDRWAIINHVGALSLVLPYFAVHTTLQSFVQHTAIFEMSNAKKWGKVAPQEVGKKYRIVP